jgi:arylsulfatase A-like enzyme
MIRKPLATLLLALAAIASGHAAQPNIVFIFVDDSGWGDFSCQGSPVLDKEGKPITPNIDRLATQGMRFTEGYVVSPICSPSRTGWLTGMHPSRHGIHSFLDTKTANANRQMDDWLQPDAITTARLLKDAGYATGLFGKWHMGGGRDVNDAPFPQAYGFEASLTSFEGMGDRILVNGHGLSEQNADVPGTITWANWHQLANLHTDAAINFITASHAANKPFFAYVPYDDTHDPYNVEPGHENDFDHITSNSTAMNFLAELNDLDRQIGRLVDAIDGLGIAGNTLIMVVGDNGAPNDNTNTLLNRNGGLRGGKGNLWEGGIRVAFLARMPGTIPAGAVNSSTPISTLDILPTYCSLAGIPLPPAPYAGEDMKDVLQGTARPRKNPLLWEFGTVSQVATAAPRLAIRDGDMKFMRNADGTDRQFYDLAADRNETNNLVADPTHAARIQQMEDNLYNWYRQTVLGEIGETATLAPGDPPATIIVDSFDVTGSNSTTTGFAATEGVNQELVSRHTGILAGTLRYIRTDTAKPASAHSIANNRLAIADAANTTAIQLSANGTAAFNFGPHIRGRRYQWKATLDLDDADPAAARMTLGIADAINPEGGVGGHDLGVQLDLVPAGTISVFKRIDAGSNAGAADINAAIRTGLPAGEPVEIRVVLQDSTDYTVFGTTYEIFVNGTSADTGSIRFANDSRYLIFDTAPNTGPAQYDNFSIETLEAGPPLIGRIPLVGLSELKPAELSGVSSVRLYWSTQPSRVFRPVISDDMATWEPLPGGSGNPLEIESLHHTIQWLEAEIPESYRQKAFIRLEAVR